MQQNNSITPKIMAIFLAFFIFSGIGYLEFLNLLDKYYGKYTFSNFIL
jgi:hypothetical protein